MSAKVVFEIGHIASLKSKITPEGFTHEWELYVRGRDSADISNYIEKVVFNLHESFPRPKRVFKEPPYSLKESGYAGFVLPIDIYLKNRDDPKKITFIYDLNLQNTGTITNVEKKVQVFKNPSDDFRRKLLKGGGFMVNNSDEKSREQDERAQLISKPKLGGSELSGKKYKSKPDDTKVSSTYANLFGSSGSKTAEKVSSDAKKASTSSTGAKQPQKTVKTSRDKPDKEKKEKNKHNSPKKEKTDGKDVPRKSQHDDKHEKREEKKKDKTHSKERGRSKDKISNAKQDPSPKRTTQTSPKRASPHRSASALSKTDDTQSSGKSFSKEPIDRTSSSAKKPKKDKKEKNTDKERDRERAKDQKQKEERPSSKVSDKIDLKKEKDSGSRNQKDKITCRSLSTKSEKQADKAEKPAKRSKKEKETKTSDKEDKKRKRKSKEETPAFSEPPLKQSKKEENGALSWRNDVGANLMSTSRNTPPPHRIDAISRSSPLLNAQKSIPSRSSSQRATPSPLSTNTAQHHQLSPNLQQQRQQKDYMSQLKELQHKIMSLEDNNELQQVVEMIIEKGKYEINGEKTFDFDLCALDRTTVQRLQTFFATSSCWL